MIAFFFSDFFTDLITFIHSFWFSFERFLNFLNQKLILSNISIDDWLMHRQISTASSNKSLKMFSAGCTNPGFFKIFSMGLTSVSGITIFEQWLLSCLRGRYWINVGNGDFRESISVGSTSSCVYIFREFETNTVIIIQLEEINIPPEF